MADTPYEENMDENIVEIEQDVYEPEKTFGQKLMVGIRWAFRLRSVALSIPVAVVAIILAVNNAANLPGPLQIGAGDNIITISKSALIMGPLALTALSILMTLVSKKVTYPWLVSLFTLLLPVILLLTMTFGI